MTISGIYRGDTEPIIIFLYDIDANGTEVPVQLVTNNCSVIFSYRMGSLTKFINGTELTDLGEVVFPVAEDSFAAGEYRYDIQVTNGITGKKRTYIVADLIIKDDITK